MKKYYLDNEYNDCACADTRIYSSRVPAEKPFESKPRKKPKCTAAGGTHQHTENRRKHRKKTDENEQRSVPQSQPPMQVLYQPLYCPNLPSDYERKKHRRNSNECSNDCIMYQNPKSVYTSPCRMPYPSTSTDVTFNKQRGVLNAQYPCPCMPVPVECTPDYMRPIPFFHTTDCKECGYSVGTQRKDSRSSAGKRAWCYIKRKTKRMIDKKSQRKEARQRKRQKRVARQNEMSKCYSPPYVYPYPVQVAPYFTCAGNSEKRDQTTYTHVSKQTEVIPETDCIESEAIDETTTDETANPPPTPPRRPRPPPPPNDITQDDSCCCHCDLEMCPCQCCHGELGCEARNTQTSCQNIRENFTQTDFPKRCCRCCRCCAKKARGIPCVKHAHSSAHNPRSPPKSPTQPSPQSNRDGRCNTCQNMNTQYYINPSPGCTRRDDARDKSNERKEKKKDSKKCKKSPVKTQMVRTNSAQCIPELENKATCCSCDQNFSCSRMNHFFQHLYGQNYDTCPNSVPQPCLSYINGPPFTSPWTTSDLNTITSAKLKNIFAGDIFSSPLSGKNYNLSVDNVASVPRIIETQLPKPLDIGDDIASMKTTTRPIYSDTQHNNLMTAICEAILTNTDDTVIDKFPIGTSDFQLNDELCSNPCLPFVNKINQPLDIRHRPLERGFQRSVQKHSIVDQSSRVDLLEQCRERINYLDDRISKLATCATDPVKNKQKNDKKEKIRNTRHSSLTRNFSKIHMRTILHPDPTSGSSSTDNDKSKSDLVKGYKESYGIEANERKPHENMVRHVEKCVSNRRHIDNLLKQLESLYDRNRQTGDASNCDTGNSLEKKAVTTQILVDEVAQKSNFGRIDSCVTERSDLYKTLARTYLNTDLTTEIIEKKGKICQNSAEEQRGQPNSSKNPTGNMQIDLNPFKKQDFSSIKFQKFDVIMGTQNASEYFQGKSMSQKNFILNNLPAYSSNISNAYGVKALLDAHKSDAIVNRKSLSFTHSCVWSSDLIHSRNKVQPVCVDVKQKLPLKMRTRENAPLISYIQNMETEQNPPEHDNQQQSIRKQTLPPT